MLWIIAVQRGEKMTELCALTVLKGARETGRWRARMSTSSRSGLASRRCLQQPQPFAHNPLRAEIALPLVFHAEAVPLVGVDGLQFGPAELAIGRRLGREQSRIRPANRRDFRHFGPHRRRRCLRRFGSLCRRATGQRRTGAKRGREAASDPQSCRNVIRHRLVGPNLLNAHWRSGRRPSGRIMSGTFESKLKN